MPARTGARAGELQLRFSGAGGQGLQLSARVLAEAAVRDGWLVAHSQGYEPTSRGGLSRSDLVLSRAAIDYPLLTCLDAVVILDDVAATASCSLLAEGSLVLVDDERVATPPAGPYRLLTLPFTATARQLGSERVANVVSLGTVNALLAVCSDDTLLAVLREETPTKLLDLNIEAFAAGRALVAALAVR